MRFLLILVVTFLLVACNGGGTLPPVRQLGAGVPRPAYYVVKPGDTLSSIGWRYGLNYHQLARWNEIHPPYLIYAGQKLRLIPPSRNTAGGSKQNVVTSGDKDRQAAELEAPANTRSAESDVVKETAAWANSARVVQGVSWCWPTSGEVIQTFSSTEPSRKGIEIAGQRGQPIVAAADGKVIYSGTGLPRYGKLLIVKHNGNFLSLYAYNRVLLSKEGDVVERGQKIAEMGHSGVSRTKLLFEIRRNGQPVNPLHYLPR